jgi:asparagine synthase (glutamine-hydrolysing)
VVHVQLIQKTWVRHGATLARGYAHLDGRYLPAREIGAALDASASDEHWRATVERLNGCFAAVTERPDCVLAAVDRVRTIPLFYAVSGRDAWLSDDAYWVLDRFGPGAVNEIGGEEFGLTGYVTGAETLFSNVRQIQAGRLLRLGAAAEQRRYYEFRHDDFFAADIDRLTPKLEALHESVFRRLLASVEGRQIVVPLSGGYDSRLIGVSLRDLGAKDVVCYSYGVPGNWESRISKELADYLGFRWEFVEYSAERWSAWASTDEFQEHFRRAGNLASVPHVQDWPAVYELERSRCIEPDGVLVPGHSGDFLAGSHIPKFVVGARTFSFRVLLDAIERAHYSLWDWPPDRANALREAFDRRIESIVGRPDTLSAEDVADLFERWDLEERQSKFICNSMRVYEGFGHEWRLPLFDAELMDFWARVPLDLRVGRRLYFEFVKRRQRLPITEANRDRSGVALMAVAAIEAIGLRPLAKDLQRRLRRLRWTSEYAGSSLAWHSLIDEAYFRETYSGRELMHSYLALRYRDLVMRDVQKARTDSVLGTAQ